jgi:hypothetical protein
MIKRTSSDVSELELPMIGHRKGVSRMDLEKLHDRRRLARAPVTLDGEPARIMAIQSDVALVETLDGKRSAQWSWHSAAQIVQAGGLFHT